MEFQVFDTKDLEDELEVENLKGIAAFCKCGGGLSYADIALGLPRPLKIRKLGELHCPCSSVS